MKHIYGERIHHLMVQVWHGPPIIILHMRTQWGVIIDLSCTSAHSLTTLSAQLRLKAENTQAELTRSLLNASSLWGYRNDTMRSTLKWSKIIPYFYPTNDLLRGKNRGEREKEKGRRRIGKDKHIPSTYSLHYKWGGGEPIIQLLTAVTG